MIRPDGSRRNWPYGTKVSRHSAAGRHQKSPDDGHARCQVDREAQMCRGDPCCLRSMVSGRRSNRCALDNAPLDRAVMSAVSRFASVGRSRSSGRIHLVGDRHAVLAVSVRSDLVGRGVTAEVAHRGNGRALADDPDRPRVCVSATPDAELVERERSLAETVDGFW
jgi:hypothetical protein